MALTFLWIFVALFFFSDLPLFAFSFQRAKPEIISAYETIIESGENFTVLCQGNTALKWSWPEVKDPNYSRWTTVKVTDVIPKNNHYKYANTMSIYNATYTYTGYYTCYDKNVDPSNEDLVSRIYLYVKDNKHLSVIDLEIDSVLVTQYHDAVLPCRPTSPDVHVQLTLLSGEKLYSGTIDEEGIMYRYHPHFGFITNQTTQVEQILYSCNFSRGNYNVLHMIIMDVEPMTHFVPKPLLEEISGGHTVVGEKLVLECRVKTPTYVTINWITPTGPPNLTRMDVSSQRRTSIDSPNIVQQLTINQTSLEDKGVYYCSVSDHLNHYSNSSLNVTILRGVSTSQLPTQFQQIDERFEEKQKIQTKLDENSLRLEILELQNKQLQKKLESRNCISTNLLHQYANLAENSNRFDALELQIKHLQSELENLKSASTKLEICGSKSNGQQSETLEFQNKKILKLLENLTITLTNHSDYHIKQIEQIQKELRINNSVLTNLTKKHDL